MHVLCDTLLRKGKKSRNRHFNAIRQYRGNKPPTEDKPDSRGRFSASLRHRNAHGHVTRSPFELSESVGVDNFKRDNSGDADPLSENAAIESETPRYFQVDNLEKNCCH